jgi:hypothetical protein
MNMIRRCLACFLFLTLVLSVSVFAQDDNYQPNVDYKVNKMQKVLNLTDSQVFAIHPIVKDYIVKREAFLQEVAGQGIIDHVAVKSTLKGLKDVEYQKLSKILSEDQMKKWIDRENLMSTLNPDSEESTVDEGSTITPAGADVKF